MRGLMDRVDVVHAAEGTVVVLERRLVSRPAAIIPTAAGVSGDPAPGTRGA
jgi:hypothetical protein